MCLAQGPQRTDAGEAQTSNPSVSSQALYHWATALTLYEIINETWFPLGDEVAEPRPDMNIKVDASTVSEKSINTMNHSRFIVSN